MILAIDIGNAFIDFVVFNEQGLKAYKLLLTPNTCTEVLTKKIDDLLLCHAIHQNNLLIVHNSHLEAIHNTLKKYSPNIIFNKKKSSYLSTHLHTSEDISELVFLKMGAHSTQFSLVEKNKYSSGQIINLGGSCIAYLDEQKSLQMNISPDVHATPACFNLGYNQPTLTDANLILGRLPHDVILGNTIRPDINSARMALATIAGKLNVRVEDAALSIINMVNERAVNALLKMIGTQDLAHLILYATGGNAGLHVCAIADALNIKNVVVPLFSGVFSAFSQLIAVDSNLKLPTLEYKKERAPHRRVSLYGITLPVSIWERHTLSPEEMIMGPAIIKEETTTTFLQNGWLAYVDAVGHLLLRRMAIDVH